MANPFSGEEFGNLIVGEVKAFVERATEKLKSDLRAEFEARFAALEEAGPKFRGVYVDGQAYHKGALVVCSGSLWHCAAGETSSRPGADANWLCCKAGTFSK
jgi:hypothetical protein